MCESVQIPPLVTSADAYINGHISAFDRTELTCHCGVSDRGHAPPAVLDLMHGFSVIEAFLDGWECAACRSEPQCLDKCLHEHRYSFAALREFQRGYAARLNREKRT